MRRLHLALFAGYIACTPALPLVAQPAEATRLQDCARELIPYTDRAALQHTEWSLTLEASGGGRLSYLGAEHSRDPHHPQFVQIAQAWAHLNPTVAFFEGPPRSVAASADETIREYGESGYVRYLAQEGGVRVERLEPSPQAEFAALHERFPLEQIKLFYLLRETSRLREREGLGEEQIKTIVAQLLERAQTMLGDQFGTPWTLADLEDAYARHWTEPAAWWQAPSSWFTPGDASSATGGVFTNDINRASSEFRDRHMYTVLAEAVRRGERVFAVVGRDHVTAQASALRCAIE